MERGARDLADERERVLNAIAEARRWLVGARRVVALTGAGISAESGVPTFRGPQGLWREFKPEELATPEAFAQNPGLVWEWYDWRRALIAGCVPNAGHLALARYEKVRVVTQNVDGLHARAGSAEVLEIHGSIWRLVCTECGAAREDLTVPLKPLPPRCASGGMERPGVVWFGEALRRGVWAESERLVRSAEVLLVVGTSGAVYPAAGLAHTARVAGAKVIEINLERTALSREVDLSLLGPSGEILPQLV